MKTRIVNKQKPSSSFLVEIINDILSGERTDFGPRETCLFEYAEIVSQLRLIYIQGEGNAVDAGEAVEMRREVCKKVRFSEEDLDDLNRFIRNEYRTEEKIREFIRKLAIVQSEKERERKKG